MWFVSSVLHCEDDLILEDKGLHTTQHPPEDDQDSQVLDPGKLEELPESRVIGGISQGQEV